MIYNQSRKNFLFLDLFSVPIRLIPTTVKGIAFSPAQTNASKFYFPVKIDLRRKKIFF